MPIFQTSSIVSGVAVTFACTTPVATSISGWTLTAYFGPQGGPSNLILDNASRGGVTVTASATGGYSVSLTTKQSQGLGVGQVVMSVWRTDSGFEDCLLQNTITFKPDPSGF